mgnify:CR=1 FL=1
MLYGKQEVICSDMGGTSFDVSLIRNGAPTLDEEPVLDKYTYQIPKTAIPWDAVPRSVREAIVREVTRQNRGRRPRRPW